jgi:hypothetical protein
MFTRLRCIDGQRRLPAVRPPSVRSAIEAEFASSSQVKSPVVVGGDRSITLPILRALTDASDPSRWSTSTHRLGPEVWATISTGTPMRHAIDED